MRFKEFHGQVRGKSHRLRGEHGQDRTGYLAKNGVQAMCLSDGAGSASQSELGAGVLVSVGTHLLADGFDDFLTGDPVDAARQIRDRLVARLEEVAARHDCDVSQLAATFLGIAVSRNGFVAAHVGDGVIGLIRRDQRAVLSSPANGEFANQTDFVGPTLTGESIRMFRGPLDDVTGFILMSDGAAESLYRAEANDIAPACSELVRFVATAPNRQVRNPHHKRELTRFLAAEVGGSTSDDCSIGLLGRPL